MRIGTLKIRLYAPWVHSLKEKRMVVQSLLAKLTNRFNVSAAEVEDQDVLQTVVIGIASVADSSAFLDSVMDKLIDFIESNTEAQVVSVEREVL
jgi:uncharacterized protein YlxP (DUF503 family)